MGDCSGLEVFTHGFWMVDESSKAKRTFSASITDLLHFRICCKTSLTFVIGVNQTSFLILLLDLDYVFSTLNSWFLNYDN